MKILDPAEAQLSNYEVLTHIQTTKQLYREDAARRGPAATMKSGNLETVMKEVIDYLNTTPAATQSPIAIATLLEKLSKFEFEKVELLMILNCRPKNETELDVVVEEMDGRLKDEEIQEVLSVIRSVLGGEEEDGEDLQGGGEAMVIEEEEKVQENAVNGDAKK